jgi:cardiolipin synthase
MQKLKLHTSLLRWISLANVSSYFTVSNLMTGLRVLMAPFLYMALIQEQWLTSFLICFLGGLTDVLDGFFARLFKQTSFFGEIFDPLADKLMVTFIYIAFFQKLLIPEIVFYTIVGRDIILVFGSLFVLRSKKQIPLHPLMLSKINTFFQFFLCAWIVSLKAYEESFNLPDIFNTFTFYIIYGTLVLTILSGLQYAKRFFNFLSQ